MARKMLTCLTPGSIGVKANQLETIEFAHAFGYEAVQPFGEELVNLDIAAVTDKLRQYRLVWGQAGLALDFRKDEETFRAGLKELPRIATALQKAGASRIGTWISPNHDALPYLANLRQHARRLREAAKVLADNGQRIGLEYVGPKTLWSAKRFPFVHSMAEMRELHSEIDMKNVGFVLDSWHWYTAGESLADLKTLRNEEIVCIDLNDAPAGIAIDQQIDSKREIPLATGVIDVRGFLNTLHALGCDAPIRCEPFNAALRAKPREEILGTVAESMRRAMALIIV
ncbi:MAG: TIM barrel protein [Acidobacteria bacterium]|nr:TIM barrel protein [Acidobacteriota bacterium]